MGEFCMPSLGADMTEGTLVQWNVKPGDHVKRGDIIAIVGTDKADIEVEVYETGVVETLTAAPGDKLAVGAPMAFIRGDGAVPVPAEPSVRPAEGVRASPLARKLARQLGIQLETVKGTGPGGVIERHDVELAAKPTEADRPPAAPTPEPGGASGMRRAIAAAMARSNREIPHFYLSTQIDMSKTLIWLEETNRQRSIEARILPAAVLLKAVAKALGRVPALNGFWVNDQWKPAEDVHIGVAVSLRTGGLVVPAIHSANTKTVEETMAALREAITRARSGRMRSSDVTDSTITVTNLGDLGVEVVHGVIYPPQVALVGFGKIVEKPWAEHGMVGARPILTATLAGDHRATDGRQGAQFLDYLNAYLQEPEKL